MPGWYKYTIIAGYVHATKAGTIYFTKMTICICNPHVTSTSNCVHATCLCFIVVWVCRCNHASGQSIALFLASALAIATTKNRRAIELHCTTSFTGFSLYRRPHTKDTSAVVLNEMAQIFWNNTRYTCVFQ